jgi:hypothetical protein
MCVACGVERHAIAIEPVTARLAGFDDVDSPAAMRPTPGKLPAVRSLRDADASFFQPSPQAKLQHVRYHGAGQPYSLAH